jgi:CRP-like cAMP-binding protein
VGIDAGIILGVLVSIVEHAILTAQTSAVKRVSKQSRAVWTPKDYKLLHEHGYNASSPKIMTLEIIGTVFFGSSLQLLERLTQEIGLDLDEDDQEEPDKEMLMRSPHQPARLLMGGVQRRRSMSIDKAPLLQRRPPKFIVLDLTQMSNLDASASRTCFLQLAKMCAKQDMVVCGAGPSPRVNWMLRSHDVAYSLEEEDRVKAQLQASRLHTLSPALFGPDNNVEAKCERVLLFLTLHEALEFSESALIRDLTANKLDKKTPSFVRLDQYGAAAVAPSISHVVSHILGLTDQEREIVEALEGERYHTEETFHAGTVVYAEGTHAGAFYVVLQGTVAVARSQEDGGLFDSNRRKGILSGAGPVRTSLTLSSKLLEDPTVLDMGKLTSFYPVGGIFGFVDFLLERPRRVKMVASQDSTIVAKFTRSQMALLRAENQPLDALLQRVLLQAAVLDLANCTCSYVD